MFFKSATRAVIAVAAAVVLLAGCGPTYKAKPLPFKAPQGQPNARQAAGSWFVAKAYVDPGEASEAFGWMIREAGLLPVQVTIDNRGPQALEIEAGQTFLQDEAGNLWPVLTNRFAYERATKYAQTNEIFKEGAYNAFLGAAAGAVVGAAIGVVSGDFGKAVGQGAAIGAASGAVLGGLKGAGSDQARQRIMEDFNDKSLKNKAIPTGGLAHGFIFFPGEAETAYELRLQVREVGGGQVYNLILPLER